MLGFQRGLQPAKALFRLGRDAHLGVTGRLFHSLNTGSFLISTFFFCLNRKQQPLHPLSILSIYHKFQPKARTNG